MEPLDAPLEAVGEVFETTETTPEELAPQIDRSEISQFFGIRPGDPVDDRDREYMSVIWNHFAGQAKTPGEVIRLISRAERQIQPPRDGETRLGKLYTYVRLLEESRSISSELSAYEK